MSKPTLQCRCGGFWASNYVIMKTAAETPCPQCGSRTNICAIRYPPERAIIDARDDIKESRVFASEPTEGSIKSNQ